MALGGKSEHILRPARVSTVAASFAIALLLDFLPWKDLRLVPDFVALVLTFWCVRQPRLVGPAGSPRSGAAPSRGSSAWEWPGASPYWSTPATACCLGSTRSPIRCSPSS